jgi:hypothetical protein
MEDNICQNIWDKSEVLWKYVGEHIGNLMGTIENLKECCGNTMGTREK